MISLLEVRAIEREEFEGRSTGMMERVLRNGEDLINHKVSWVINHKDGLLP